VPFLSDLVSLFQTDGVGTLGLTIFTSTKASIPMLASGATLQIVETGGSAPERTQNAVVFPAYLRPSAMLVARAKSPAVAREMADAAYQSSVKVRNQFIGSNWYREIKPLQEPNDALGVDDRGQAQCSFNITADYNRRD
jgi:hypothetical protein